MPSSAPLSPAREIEVLALAAVRSTREGTVKHGKETLPVIIGAPMQGEEMNGQKFDGNAETALFPGDLPKNPDSLFELAKGQGIGGRPTPASSASARLRLKHRPVARRCPCPISGWTAPLNS